jgi:predicted Rossmann fold flavoprotein
MNQKTGQFDLIVIGGGAAGFFCAINAARLSPGLRVVILEKTGKLLQKVKVSGGGRCNTTHHIFESAVLIKKYPRGEKFLKKAFQHFTTKNTIQWFAERGVPLKTEADGRMFPETNNSETIINCLIREAEIYRVEIWVHGAVESLKRESDAWQLELADKRTISGKAVCIASGGFPKSESYNWITAYTGHSISSPVPSLFTFNTPGHSIVRLMGVVQEARVKIAGTKHESEGPVLITHWGLSGPAILRTSAFAARDLAAMGYHFEIIINWLPAFNENSLRDKILAYRQEKGNKKIINTEWIHLPTRLFEYLLSESEIDINQRWADLPAQKQNRLVKQICAFTLQAKGKTTFKEEFVTAGGINLNEIDPNTMQSKLCKELYFAGEIMDVDGITGGFNFQHAWTSGMIAANAIAASVATGN